MIVQKIRSGFYLANKVILVNFLLTVFFVSDLRPILDGRTNPIYLDTAYTFTQGEWARGSVFFRKGFDLPVGGTIYLGIDTGFVNGPINLNGGTLTLEKPLFLKNQGSIFASGFIRGTPGRPDSMVIKYEGNSVWEGSGTIKIIQTSMTFQGNSATMDNLGVTIDLREAGSDIFFVGGRIILRSWRTSTTTPARIWFFDNDIVATDSSPAGFSNPEVHFGGYVSFTTSRRIWTVKKIFLEEFAHLVIRSGCRITVNQISLPYAGTRLEVRRSLLNFTSTSTGSLRMITPYAHNIQGTISFDGKCDLSSSTNNPLIFDKYATLELLSGAQLRLQQGTKLSFE